MNLLNPQTIENNNNWNTLLVVEVTEYDVWDNEIGSSVSMRVWSLSINSSSIYFDMAGFCGLNIFLQNRIENIKPSFFFDIY